MLCCPLTGCDDDEERPTSYSKKTRVAGKNRACSECRESIPKGSSYEHVSGIWCGMRSTYTTCLSCVEIRDHFACNGFIYEQLWEDLEDNFFPDMKMGGPCMEGLSVQAKQRLVDMRMRWYFAQDEVDDSVWEDWKERRPSP